MNEEMIQLADYLIPSIRLLTSTISELPSPSDFRSLAGKILFFLLLRV